MTKKDKITLEDHLYFHQDTKVHPAAEKMFSKLNKEEKKLLVSLCRDMYHKGLAHGIEAGQIVCADRNNIPY